MIKNPYFRSAALFFHGKLMAGEFKGTHFEPYVIRVMEALSSGADKSSLHEYLTDLFRHLPPEYVNEYLYIHPRRPSYQTLTDEMLKHMTIPAMIYSLRWRNNVPRPPAIHAGLEPSVIRITVVGWDFVQIRNAIATGEEHKLPYRLVPLSIWYSL